MDRTVLSHEASSTSGWIPFGGGVGQNIDKLIIILGQNVPGARSNGTKKRRTHFHQTELTDWLLHICQAPPIKLQRYNFVRLPLQKNKNPY